MWIEKVIGKNINKRNVVSQPVRIPLLRALESLHAPTRVRLLLLILLQIGVVPAEHLWLWVVSIKEPIGPVLRALVHDCLRHRICVTHAVSLSPHKVLLLVLVRHVVLRVVQLNLVEGLTLVGIYLLIMRWLRLLFFNLLHL